MAVTHWGGDNDWAVTAVNFTTKFYEDIYSFTSVFAIKSDVQTTDITAKCDKIKRSKKPPDIAHSFALQSLN